MSALACGEPLSLAHLPADQVVRLAGLTEEQLAVGLDPLPEGSPVVIRYHQSRTPLLPREFVDGVLDRLESIARDLFPAWLPGAELICDTSHSINGWCARSRMGTQRTVRTSVRSSPTWPRRR